MDRRYNRVKEEIATDSTGAEEESNMTFEQEVDKSFKQKNFAITENNEAASFTHALNRKRKRTSVSYEILDNARNSNPSDNLLISSVLNTGGDGIKFEESARAKTYVKHFESDFSFISKNNSESSMNIVESNMPPGNKYNAVSGKVRDGPVSPDISLQVSSRNDNIADSMLETTIKSENANTVAGPSGIGPQTLKPGREIFICNLCDKVLENNCDFDMHYRTHTDKKLFVCNVCQREYAGKGNFDRHYRTHTDERPFVCDNCGKKYSRKDYLDRHYRVHTGEKPHVCDVCQKGFPEKRNLDNHYRTHTGEKPYVCEVCQKRFAQKYALNRHNLIHIGEKPFECDICKKKFSQKGHLDNHNRTHTGERPFVCEVCKKGFTVRRSLTRHEQTHTGKQRNLCHISGKASIEICNCSKDHKEKHE